MLYGKKLVPTQYIEEYRSREADTVKMRPAPIVHEGTLHMKSPNIELI